MHAMQAVTWVPREARARQEGPTPTSGPQLKFPVMLLFPAVLAVYLEVKWALDHSYTSVPCIPRINQDTGP